MVHGSGVELADYDLLTLPSGPDVDEHTRATSVAAALAQLLANHRFGAEPVIISVPGQMMLNRTLSLPPVQEKRIPEIVRYEARQLIPFPLDEIVWDYQLVAAEPGVEEREAVLFAVKEEVVRDILGPTVASDFPVDGMQVAPLAAYNLVKFDRDPQEPVAILDMGASTTDLIVLDGNRFWLRNLPIAGDDITEAFQDKFSMTFEEAEDLKRKAAESKQADKILNVMRPVLRDLVGEVQRSMGFYKSQTAGVKFSKVLLLGNGASQAGLKDFLSDHLEYDVEDVVSLERVALAAGIDGATFSQNVRAFGVAMGLALQGLDRATINVNLLPQDLAFKRQLLRKKPFVVAAVGVLALALFVSYVSSRFQIGGTKEPLKEIRAKVQNVERLRGEYQSAKDEVDPVREDLKKLGDLSGLRVPWADILKKITTKASPEGVWFNSLECSYKTVGGLTKSIAPVPSPGGPGGGSGGPGGPGDGPGGPGGPGAPPPEAEKQVVEGQSKVLHFVLKGTSEKADLGVKYIIENVERSLATVPEFWNVKLIEAPKKDITVKAVPKLQEAAADAVADETAPEALTAVMKDEKVDVHVFTVEWDYAPKRPEQPKPKEE